MIFSTPKQTLAAQVTFMREDCQAHREPAHGPRQREQQRRPDSSRREHGQSGRHPQSLFGRPYLRSSEPFLRVKPMLWDTARAQAVYRCRFRPETTVSPSGSAPSSSLATMNTRISRIISTTTGTPALGLDKAWQQKYAAANTILGGKRRETSIPQYLINGTPVPATSARVNEQYYVGSTPGGGIQNTPRAISPKGISVPYVWGPTPGAMIKDVSAIGFPGLRWRPPTSTRSSRPRVACFRALS
jgi:hypothetical protein